jgi:two-component system chemotaxis sensor kinase CheA
MTDIQNVFIFVQEDNDIKIQDVSDLLHEDIDNRDKDLKEILRVEKKTGKVLVNQGKTREKEAAETTTSQNKLQTFFRKPMVRVKTERLDRLVNLMEEMTIGLDTLFLLLEKFAIRNGKIQDELERLIGVGREAQEQVMMTRMFPLEGTFGRFQRMIRDLSVSQNKPIRVIMSGTETELDKDIVEQLGDPLKHIIRNCLDHGIEDREERKKKEKPEEGTISLKAYQKEGRIYIEISDDGRGIDDQRILEKAIHKNQLPAGSAPSKEELYKFLFLPGFSTSDEISELSGRGVGLDVVQTNVSGLGGDINIVSEKDRGTTFIIDLPMTLAIMKAIKIRVGEEIFLVPFSVIAGLIRPQQDDIKTIEGREELIHFQGEYMTLIRLSEVFKIEYPSMEEPVGIVVIVESEKRRFGILADDILDEQQVVIKNLETNFQKVSGIAGGSILGDGQVALIIDIYALEKMLFTKDYKERSLKDLPQDNQKDLRVFEG